MTRLLNRLWADDCGAVLTLEYLTLGSIVGLGSAAGLTSMKNAMNAECQEFGASVHEVTHAYRAPAHDYRLARPAAELSAGDRLQVQMTP